MTHILTLDFWRTFWLHALETITSRGLVIVACLLGYVIARSLTNRLIDVSVARFVSRSPAARDNEERRNRLRTLQGVVRSVAAYLLLFVLMVMLLDALGANVAGLITTAGVSGIAIGLGAQKLVKDVISGFFVIVEDQFAVGDYVTIGTASGVVVELGMRSTKLRDDSGRLWIVSNGDIATVTNHSRAPVASSIEIGLAPTADARKAEELIAAVCAELFAAEPGRLQSAPRVAGVSGWDQFHTLIRVTLACDPTSLAAEQLRLRTAIHTKLAEAAIPMA